MGWATVLYASEINFLTGFAEICLFNDFEDRVVPKVLWGTRIILLSLCFGLWAYQGFGTACLILLITSVVFYSVSAQLGHADVEDNNKFARDYELCFYLSNITIINWVGAVPFSLGKGKHRERAGWLFINFLAFAIIAGVYFTDGPMRQAWGCYPPTVAWDDIGKAGICPQLKSKGTYLTCSTPPVKNSFYLACQSFPWVESLGSDAVRVAMLMAALSIGVYLASIPRNLRAAFYVEEAPEPTPKPAPSSKENKQEEVFRQLEEKYSLRPKRANDDPFFD